MKRCPITYEIIKVLTLVLNEFQELQPHWKKLIGRSFLSEQMQIKYLHLLETRSERLEFSI